MDLYRQGLQRTRGTFWGRIRDLFTQKTAIEGEDLERIEELLVQADVGVAYTVKIVEGLRRSLSQGVVLDDSGLKASLHRQITDLLAVAGTVDRPFLEKRDPQRQGPNVFLVVGVNGTGKTTTIGKLAHRLRQAGQRVLLVAADTYRAAAVQQLGIWAERSGSLFAGAREGSDPAAVVHDAVSKAVSSGIDAVLIDTAGRLHTREPLMRELEKIRRVAGKIVQGAPHSTLLVLDATTGQNALTQAREFVQAAGVTGMVLAKMDGTAKGGIIIPIAGELSLPVLYVGLGEGIEDLVPFEPEAFARGLLGE
ncbi:MAG: signal recognition particle-docking protein FtsY [bacterium]|nr:MAG: signal recognition particle-docking protein FtsY [bacterium]